MFYTVYKITNQVDGRFYIGSHKTRNLDDDYMGSGKYLKRAQRKWGIHNFTKEILFVFETPDEMYAKEAELVNEEFVERPDTYNIKTGGYGGWDYNNSEVGLQRREHTFKKMQAASAKRFSERFAEDDEFRLGVLTKLEESRPAAIAATKDNFPNGTFFGRKHTEQTKQKMRDAKVGASLGKNNSQYGTRWITNGVDNRKHRGDHIPDGWRYGRS